MVAMIPGLPIPVEGAVMSEGDDWKGRLVALIHRPRGIVESGPCGGCGRGATGL